MGTQAHAVCAIDCVGVRSRDSHILMIGVCAFSGPRVADDTAGNGQPPATYDTAANGQPPATYDTAANGQPGPATCKCAGLMLASALPRGFGC